MEKVINEGAVAREASREFDLKSVVLRQESRAEQSHQDCRSITVNSSYRLRLVGRNGLSNKQHTAPRCDPDAGPAIVVLAALLRWCLEMLGLR